MTIDEKILVNQLAQGIIEIQAGIAWFSSLDLPTRRSALAECNVFIANANPRPEDAANAVSASGLKPTFTPCILLMTGASIREQIAKIANLPESELEKAFRLLIALFGIADTRRRTLKPLDTKNHWWHRDLRDESVLTSIRREFQH
jgi:hypothetical protein